MLKKLISVFRRGRADAPGPLLSDNEVEAESRHWSFWLVVALIFTSGMVTMLLLLLSLEIGLRGPFER